VPPSEREPRRGSLLAVFMAGMVFLALFVLLLCLALPVATVLIGGAGMVLLIFLFSAFHYFVWGWWLGPVIQESEREAERKKAEEDANRE